MGRCIVDWCDKKAHVRGYCKRHIQQIYAWGETRRAKGDRNEIIIKEDWAEIILYDKDYNEKARAFIDSEDIAKCSPYKWVYRNDGYISAKVNGKGVKLHRFIANTPNGMHTDHINRNKLDNRKENLRICTQAENNKNKSRYIKNKSGKSGVTVNGNGYQAEIRIDNEKHYIGYFLDLKDAITAREEAEVKFYGKVLDR